MEVNLEVCAGCIESVWAAQRGGAYRVELCSGLDEGGLTPSSGFLETALAVPGLKKNVLIRPRGGDFLYTEAEKRVMLRDVEYACSLGVDGVVIGALMQNGDIDVQTVKALMQVASGVEVTFHRAFDLCREPFVALEQIVDLGCKRILTSGTASTAEEGIPVLKRLVEAAAGRLVIMPGCGVGAGNAAKIIKETGACEIHASARDVMPSQMVYRHAGVEMGKAGVDEYSRMATSQEKVRKIVECMKKM